MNMFSFPASCLCDRISTSFWKRLVFFSSVLLLVTASPCVANTFSYAGYVEWVSEGAWHRFPIQVGEPSTLYLYVGDDPGPDQNPDPNIGSYGGTEYNLTGDAYYYSSWHSTGNSIGYQYLANTAGGDSVDMEAEAGDSVSWVHLHFRDTSGGALTSGAWTQRYERANWQTIQFDFLSSYYEDSNGMRILNEDSYGVRIPLAEAESLPVQAKSAVSSGVFSDSRLCAGGGAWVSTKAPGQFITYTAPVHQPGNYLVRVGTRTSPNKGKFQLSINEVKVGAVQDEYSPTIDNGFLDLGEVSFFTSGDKAFNFVVTERNPSSSGYTLAFDYIDLIPTKQLQVFSETESLTVEAKSPVAAGVFTAADMSGGAGTFLKASQVGDFITYTVPVAQPATYAVYVGVRTRPDKGIFQMSINGNKKGTPKDEYSPAIGTRILSLGKVTFPKSGNKALGFTVTGKNANSTGYSLAFDYIKLVPTNP